MGFRVIVNGTESEEADVTSGVPKGTVLAAILFTIMISDIDEEVKNSISRCFADDTRVNKNIKTEADRKKMQEDLDIVYKWAEDNAMKFNGNKFEPLSYGQVDNVNFKSYKNPSGDPS